MGIIDRSLGYAPAQKAWKGGKKRKRAKHRTPVETPESIARCLSCTRPADHCSGCMDGQGIGSGRPGRPSKYDPAVLDEMLRMGFGRADIAKQFGVSISTVGSWVKKLKEEQV